MAAEPDKITITPYQYNIILGKAGVEILQKMIPNLPMTGVKVFTTASLLDNKNARELKMVKDLDGEDEGVVLSRLFGAARAPCERYLRSKIANLDELHLDDVRGQEGAGMEKVLSKKLATQFERGIKRAIDQGIKEALGAGVAG